jgi:excisionase family DNA binding protein
MSARAAKTVTVQELAQLLGISRNHAFRSVQRGEIPSFRIGRRLLIPVSFLDAVLDASTAPGLGSEMPHRGSRQVNVRH